jgi:hypothetical protein
MNVSDALERIGAIHEQLAKSEVYRGYHPVAVGLSGLGGLVAASLQPWFLEPDDPVLFLRYWLIVGVLCGLIAGAATLYRYLTAEDEFARRRTRTVVGQFLPCLAGGAAVTAALARPELAAVGVPLLPGLWAVLFGLGVAASGPYLPRSVAWVAAWYVAAGFVLLLGVASPIALSGWTVGVPFGAGQMAMALVLRAAGHQSEEAGQ